VTICRPIRSADNEILKKLAGITLAGGLGLYWIDFLHPICRLLAEPYRSDRNSGGIVADYRNST
jgi:hypothetical protein